MAVGEDVARSASHSPGAQTWAPCLPSSRSRASATRSSATSTDSFVHSSELSKAFESTSSAAARATSAVASTSAGTLPGPTPIAGLPER